MKPSRLHATQRTAQRVLIATFLDHDIDLSGTIWTDNDRAHARRFLQDALEAVMPGWLAAPSGVIGRLWLSDTTPAACQIIDIARVLYELDGRVTARSQPLLVEKLRHLFSADDERGYEELMSELRVGAWLATTAPPVALEPCATLEEITDRGERSKSPDYGVKLPEGIVGIEATTLRVQEFDRWLQTLLLLEERIRSTLSSARIWRDVVVSAPLGVRSDWTRAHAGQLRRELRDNPSGELELRLAKPVRVSWQTLLRYASVEEWQESGDRAAAAVIGGHPGSGIEIPQAASVRFTFAWDQYAVDVLTNSLRNTIDGKRDQVPDGSPLLLVLQIGSWGIDVDHLVSIVESTIWPNPVYSWLSGVSVLTPRRAFNLGASQESIRSSVNANARTPATESLIHLLRGDLQQRMDHARTPLPAD